MLTAPTDVTGSNKYNFVLILSTTSKCFTNIDEFNLIALQEGRHLLVAKSEANDKSHNYNIGLLTPYAMLGKS